MQTQVAKLPSALGAAGFHLSPCVNLPPLPSTVGKWNLTGWSPAQPWCLTGWMEDLSGETSVLCEGTWLLVGPAKPL